MSERVNDTIRQHWILATGIASEYRYTYDLDSHPESYDGPCICRTCRTYMAEEADKENANTGSV